MAITTTMKRLSAFSLLVLFACAFLVKANGAVESPPISTYGMVNYSTSEYLYGVWSGSTSWEVWGKAWSTYHLDMVANAGGNFVCYAVDKRGWDANDTRNVLGVPFWDYLETMVDEGKQRGINSMLCLHYITAPNNGYFDLNGDGRWGSYEKNMMITDSAYRQQWIQWGSDMITHCDPWGLCIMDEPGRAVAGSPITIAQYVDFAEECIETWQAINPDLYVMTYGPAAVATNRDLSYWHTDPLHERYNNILYTSVCYLWSFDGYATDPTNEQPLLDWLQNYGIYGDIAERTVLSVGAETTTEAGGNWQYYMDDVYQWCKDNTYGLMPWFANDKNSNGYTGDLNWNLLQGGGDDWWSWSAFGEYWAGNAPS